MVLYKEFKVGDLFDIGGSKKVINKNMITKFNGKYPYVTRTEMNNGVSDYIEYDEESLNEGNTITLGMDTYVINYQPTPYYTGNRVKVIKYEGINKYNARYVVTALRKLFIGYSWGMGIKQSQMNDMNLQLPVKTLEDTEPDWEYMEEYIKQKELAYIGKLNKEFEQKKEQLIELIGEESEYINIEELPTAKFKVGDLFEVGRGNIGNQGNLKEDNGGINFIAQNDSNNGYVMKVKEEEYKVFKGNAIVVGRQTGAIYYQKEEFVTTDGVLVMESDDVIRSEEVGLYITSLLVKQMVMFGYTNTVSAKKLNELEIELPINPEVSELVPDWNTMEDYINGIKHLYLHKEESNHKEKLELLFELTGWTEQDLDNIENLEGQ